MAPSAGALRDLLSSDASLELILPGRDPGRAADAAAELRQTARSKVESAAFDAFAAHAQDARRSRAKHRHQCLRTLSEGNLCTGCKPASARDVTTSISPTRAGLLPAYRLSTPGRATRTFSWSAGRARCRACRRRWCAATRRSSAASHRSTSASRPATASILEWERWSPCSAAVGAPLAMKLDGGWRRVHGWQGLRLQNFGEAGRRFVGYVDVPDLDLFAHH